jgi:hypothetical protein
MKIKIIAIVLIFLMNLSIGKAQENREDKTKEYITWALMQLIPSPTYYQDTDGKKSRVQFGLKWQITPLNISFNTNKYISRYQAFMINPVRRFTGSIEAFIQPEVITDEFKYSNLKNLALSGGTRVIMPISEYGEDMSGSLGVKYTYRKDNQGNKSNYPGLEAGMYFFAGLVGVQYTQNFDARTNFNISIYIKYF